MRVLFTFSGGRGHAEPLVPIARAVEAAGHDVAFAGRAWVVANLAERGFTVGADPGSPDEPPSERIPLVEVDMEREYKVLRYGFAGRAGARADATLAFAAEWQPDVIVRDETDFGSAIAAERLGLPGATVLELAAGSFVRPDLIAGTLAAVRAEYDLPPDPELEMLSRDLVLSPFPPSFRDPAFPLPPTAHSIRTFAAVAGEDLDWLARLPHATTIYFTLGTVFNVESGDLFSRVVAGLRELPVNVVVTVGSQIDPVAELGPQPANVYVERYIAQSVVLPRCDLVVSHGGSGSVVGALAHGLPQVVIPIGADQPLNGGRVEALHLGRALNAMRATPADVRTAVSEVLADPTYREAAVRMKTELDALPGPERAVPLLEQLS